MNEHLNTQIKEEVPQTIKEIVEDRLKLIDIEKPLNEIQNEFLEKINEHNSMEDHIKFVYTKSSIKDTMLPHISVEDFPFITQEHINIIDELQNEQDTIKDELREYEIGNPEFKDEILEKFGNRCFELRKKSSFLTIELLYKLFKNLNMNSSEFFKQS